MQKISPMLWLPGNVEEAVDHSTSSSTGWATPTPRGSTA